MGDGSGDVGYAVGTKQVESCKYTCPVTSRHSMWKERPGRPFFAPVAVRNPKNCCQAINTCHRDLCTVVDASIEAAAEREKAPTTSIFSIFQTGPTEHASVSTNAPMYLVACRCNHLRYPTPHPIPCLSSPLGHGSVISPRAILRSRLPKTTYVGTTLRGTTNSAPCTTRQPRRLAPLSYTWGTLISASLVRLERSSTRFSHGLTSLLMPAAIALLSSPSPPSSFSAFAASADFSSSDMAWFPL